MKIIIGITGSVAAYKSIEIAKLLLENSFEIEVVLSKSAAEFVSPLTLRSLFPGKIYLWDDALGKNDEMLHISLAKSADLIIIAPASANMISKLVNAQADCLLTTLCLASKAPIIVAPAMNKIMWENEFVRANVAKLKYIIGPASGQQACGDNGFGRMVEPSEIVEYIKSFFVKKILQNKRIVITAGPTLESIDPVRFISNYSSGKMGYALAKKAQDMGAEVTLISGPTSIPSVKVTNFISVESTHEMLQASLDYAKNCDIFIGAAAVSDYTPQIFTKEKIKKNSDTLSLSLKKNPDIIATIKQEFSNIFVVGFAAETNNLEDYGLKKLKDKNIDMIAINDVSENKVFGQEFNELHVINSDKQRSLIKRAPKEEVASQLLEIIQNRYSKVT